jgi:hypothetical protein
MLAIKRSLLALSALGLGFSSLAAQTPPAPPPGAPAPPVRVVEPKLVFDREVFTYAGQGRRDPFQALQGTDAMGPLFEDLVLRSIIWSPVPTQSLALINDGTRKTYTKRLGDVIGNSRIIGIERNRVRFAVMSYGITREEILTQVQRQSVTDLQQQEQSKEGEELGRLFQQQMLRYLRGDTTTPGGRAGAAPTGPTGATGRATASPQQPGRTSGRTPPPVRRDTMESMR